MGSIPLPALAVNPPPNVLDQYAKLAQLKSLLQGQQSQQQEMQQRQQLFPSQLQGAQAEAQKAQMQQADVKAMTDSMKQWDGKDVNDLPALILKNGGSANAVFSTKNQILQYQTNLNKMTESQLGVEATKNDMIAGHIDNVKNLPPEQQPAAFDAAKQDLLQKGYITPQQAQGMTYQGPDQLDSLEKMYMAHSTQVGNALKTAQTSSAQAGVWKEIPGTGMLFNPITNEAKSPAGQVMTPAMMESKYVQVQQDRNMGKPVSQQDAAFAKGFEKMKTLVPQFNINMGSQMTPQALDQMATQFAQTGTLPSVGYGAAGTIMRQKIANRAAELFPDNSLALAKAAYGGTEGALKHIQTQFSQVDAFENTALKNLDQVLITGKNIPDLGARFANTPIRAINEKVLGTPQMAQFRVALATAQNETAKVLNSANATGVLSDSARGELQQVLSGNLPYPAMVSAINQLKTDMNNRHQSYQDQINQLKGQVTAPQGGQQPAPGAQPQQPQQHIAGGAANGLKEGQTGTGSDGKKYVVKGGTWVPAQ